MPNVPAPLETATCRYCGEAITRNVVARGRVEYASIEEAEAAYVVACAENADRGHKPRPEVGMPLTWSIGSDRYVDVITAVTASFKTVTTKRGRKFTLRADDTYRAVGTDYSFASINVVAPYLDPSF